MRQYTTPDQTAKLIELGFESPNSIGEEVEEILKVIAPLGNFEIPISNNCPAYSVGELIEMLPDIINILHHAVLKIETTGLKWHVKYEGDRGVEYLTYNTQLISALYDMVIELKEERVV